MRSYLAEVPMGAPDAILGIAEAFRASSANDKVNVAVGAYRDSDGLPWVLPAVQAAEARLLARGEKKEYAPIDGLPAFLERATRFAFGADCAALNEGRIAAVQTLSGTGACRIAAEFYERFLPRGTLVYLPDPTWGNHVQIMQEAGLEVRRYRYCERSSCTLDIAGFLQDLHAAPEGSIFLLHACAHNPTGVDPSLAQWDEISKALLAKRHHVLLDCAYQGFASGDAEQDAFSIRKLLADGHSLLLAQSFAKNFGLYGERVGTLSVACTDREEATRVLSQLKRIIRPMYSSPPIHGALIIAEVLGDEALSAQYYAECAEMAMRIKRMRSLLRQRLAAAGSEHDWQRITDQIGMFAYTGMSTEMCDALTAEHNIFLTRDGRISLAGINEENVDYVAQAIHTVSTGQALGSD
jgi:aspartate aminotransferase